MSSNKSKFQYSSSEKKKRQGILNATKDSIKKVGNYKPTKLKVEKNTYTNDSPKRPKMPTLPKLKTIKSTKVDNPSGLKGSIKDFQPKKLKVAKVYKNLPDKKSKPKTSSSFNLPATKVGSLGVPSTKKAPGLTIKKSGKK